MRAYTPHRAPEVLLAKELHHGNEQDGDGSPEGEERDEDGEQSPTFNDRHRGLHDLRLFPGESRQDSSHRADDQPAQPLGDKAGSHENLLFRCEICPI